MITLAIANHKGGVGKTATAHALGVCLAREHGRRVLLVDCDPQGSLTGACGVQDAGDRSLAEILGGSEPGPLDVTDVILDTGEVDLVPGDIALSNVELGLVSRMGRENALRRALAPIEGDYDVAILDAPPSLGLLTVNVLSAADAVLIPTQAEVLALRGLDLFLDSLERVRDALNPGLEVLGILVTFHEPRLLHQRDALATMQEAGLPLLDVTVGRSVRVAEAAADGESVVTYEPDNKRAKEYRELGRVVAEWLEGKDA